MVRLARFVAPGQAHYILLCGLGQPAIALDDIDRQQCLAAVFQAAADHGVALHAYALLPNELHLLATPPDGQALSGMMQAFGRRYVAAYNRRHQRGGTLWTGRFRAGVVEAGAATLECMTLIDTLAGMPDAETPAAPPWCSAAHYLGQRREQSLVAPRAYWLLGNTPYAREAAYARLLGQGLPPSRVDAIRQSAWRGGVLGSESFLAQLVALAPARLRPRPRGRPRKTVA